MQSKCKNIFVILLGLFLAISSNAQIINFPDANFKAALLEQNFGGVWSLDDNNDGEIEVSEALNWPYSLQLGYAGISDLTGIEYFTNVDYLYVHNNNLVDVDLSSLINLKFLKINDNLLNNLDISSLTNLESIQCYNNQISSLDFSGLTNIGSINCSNNQLTSLILDNYSALTHLYCNNNMLSNLDVNDSPNLVILRCFSNNLVSLNIKNDSVEELDFSDNPNLQYVCADGAQLLDIEDKINQYGYSDCYANSLCSFIEGEAFYTLTGNVKYDEGNDGCSVTDINFEDLMFTISDGMNSGGAYSNYIGDYQYNVQAGSYTLIPTLPNTTYFSISPTSVSTIFPDELSPSNQDFCLSPNGAFPDLEISLITLDSDYDYTATFEILYTNKGTMTQSGVVNLAFDDALIDFTSSVPIVSEQNLNELIWQFNDLRPFETRTIEVYVDFNVPPVGEGDVLSFTGTISSGLPDETPDDNTVVLNHTFFCCLLDTPSFEFSDYFSLFPNPTEHTIHLKLKTEIDINSIHVYSILGQEVIEYPYKSEDIIIDVSNLHSGYYFIRISTSINDFVTKFIKK